MYSLRDRVALRTRSAGRSEPRWGPVRGEGRDRIKSEIVRRFHASGCTRCIHMEVDMVAIPDVWHQPVSFKWAQYDEYPLAVLSTGKDPLDRSKILILGSLSGLGLNRLAEVRRRQDKRAPDICFASTRRTPFERCEDGKKCAAGVQRRDETSLDKGHNVRMKEMFRWFCLGRQLNLSFALPLLVNLPFMFFFHLCSGK